MTTFFNAPHNETRYALLVESISDYAVYMLDPSGHVSSWNAGAQRFKGYLPDEIIGHHFSCFYVPDDQAAGVPARALATALAEGKFEAEGWRVRKDGTRFWAHVIIDPIRDASGAHIGFAKITRDITERKAAQDALEESERRFRLLVQGVTDYALYMLSPDGMVTNWNVGAERIKGYTEPEVVGTHFSRFHTPEDQARQLPQKTLEMAKKEGRYEHEGWRVRKDGTQFWANVVIDAIFDDAGELVGFAKITRDITERKNYTEALEKASEALFQSQKLEALGQLTGGVAHDFNNLLGVMANGLELMSLRARDHVDSKTIDSMRRAVQRGATLTQQLLSFARQQPLKSENLDVQALIRNFESVLRRAVNARVRLSLNMNASLATVSIDAARFEAAILNLVVNARDAMEQGGDVVIATDTVALRQGEVGSLPTGFYLKVTVTDTGCGMPPEVAARAFEPFYTTKEIGKGTGLGLSQVHGFIAQSGGEVELRSHPGFGTTISLYLPAVSGHAGSERSTEDIASADTILVVEDDPDVLDMTAELIRSIGYEVLTAATGQEALDVLVRTPGVSIVFSDVMMPNGISGIELAQTIKATYPGLKVILASGHPLPVLRAEHASLSDYAFISKPYALPDLARTLRAARHR